MTDKWTIANALDEIASYLELTETNPFKVKAFEKAARAVEASDADLAQLARTGGLLSISGIGKAIGPIVEELALTGRSTALEELRAQYPAGILELMRVPGLGLKKIGILYSELGVSSLDELETAARGPRLAKLKGFGTKTAQRILEGIAAARSRKSFFLLPDGLEAGEAVRQRLAALKSIGGSEVAGSVRRRMETVGNVNVVVAAKDIRKAAAAIREHAVLDGIEEVTPSLLRGTGRERIQVLLHLTPPGDFGAAMLAATGSTQFLDAFAKRLAQKDCELRDGALFHRGRHVDTPAEEDVFERAGVAFVEPELRESGEALGQRKRARLVEPSDLRGTFHIHTTWSDGRNSVEEMLGAARERGFEYAGLSDHSQNACYARGLTEDDLRRQAAEVERLRAGVAPMRVFRGTEADILNDGSIDYGPALAQFDFVVASVHSRFGMGKDEMTERLLRALDDPFVTFLGHLTGRLLLARDGYTFDFDRVLDRAAERGVMIEINGSPKRLELDWRDIRRAVDRGIVLSIHPDAHSIRELSYVISGTWVARKGGLPPAAIFNTRPADEVADYLAKRRRRAIAQQPGR